VVLPVVRSCVGHSGSGGRYELARPHGWWWPFDGSPGPRVRGSEKQLVQPGRANLIHA
ncbi:uncharacterized protein METZ01_LOCUS381998, partial [marine metagenome]